MKKQETTRKFSDQWFAGLGLLIFAFILYGNTIPNDYSLDDIYVANGNPQVEKGIAGIPEIFTSLYANVNNDDGSAMRFGYRPIVTTTFAIEKEFFGNAPHISHFFNVLFYGLLLIVLFRLLRRLMQNYHPMFPLLAVVLFAAHPVHTEVVASLKNRDELLMFLFAFLSIDFFVRYYDRQKFVHLVVGMLLLLLAYLSKASAIVYLAVFPLVLYFFRDVKAKRIMLIVGVALIAIAIARFVPRMFLPSTTRPILYVENPLLFVDDKMLHISTGFQILLFYIGKMLWPSPLLFYYGFDTISVVGFGNPMVIVSILIHIALAGLAIYFIKRKHIVSFSILFYFITISIYANMVKPVMGMVADRFMFAPVLGLSLLLVYLFFILTKTPIFMQTKSMKNYGVIILSLVVLLPAVGMTINRNKSWETQLTLTSADIGHLENSAKANFIHGLTLKHEIVAKQLWRKPEGKAQVDEMIAHFRKAIEIYPKYYDAWNQLGEIYMVVRKDHKIATKLFLKAISINPELRKAYYNLGYINFRDKHFDVAKTYFLKFLEFEPEHVQVHSILSKMAFRQKKLDEAIEWNKKILEFDPESAEAYFNIGNYLLQNGDTLVAVENFEKSVELEPRNTQLNKNLYRHFKSHGNEKKANYYLNLNKN